MDKNTEYNNQALEDVLYEVGTPAATAFGKEEYLTMMQAFNDAQSVKELSYHVGFKSLLKQLEDESLAAAQLERAYRGGDEKRIADLRLKRINADYAVEKVRGIVDDAVQTPRPVLYQETQQ